ncbi:Nucleolar protein 9 [Rhizoclosmatium hyalinum]|nr:Nucleolar protein 9 [Rhizoclosmatium hyalinum]
MLALLLGITEGFFRIKHKTTALSFTDALTQNDFPGLDAYTQLTQIAQKPHPSGSPENDRIFTYLLTTLQEYKNTSKSEMQVIIHDNKIYQPFKQLLVYFPGTTNSTVLFSAHFDSVPVSPGASDDGAAITVLLQLARIYSTKTPSNSRNSFLLFFNNAEEDGLVGSYALLKDPTLTPYVKNIKVFANFEGGGAGGKPILFRTTSSQLTQALIGAWFVAGKWQSRQIIGDERNGPTIQDSGLQVYIGLAVACILALVFTALNLPALYLLALGAIARMVVVAILKIKKRGSKVPLVYEISPVGSVVVFGSVLAVVTFYPLLMLTDFLLVMSRHTVGTYYFAAIVLLTVMPIGGALLSKRRGKRGGAAVKRSTDALEEKTEILFTLDRSGASPEQNQLEPEPEPEPEPLNSEQQSTEKEKEKEKEKKKRRGKRGGAAAKEKEKKSDDNDEAYASINVVQDDSPQLEDGVDEGAQVSKDDKWAARMERKKKYAEAGITDPNAYDHIAATHGTYRDSDKLLPHRDPNLPDQPELGRVDPDVQVYFMSVEKMLDEQEFETDEDRILFVQNVYREVGANDVKLAADSECSRVLEKLIRLSSDVQVRRLMRSFTGMYSELFRHRFASHVAQTLLSLVADIVEREQIHGPAPEPEDEDPVEGAPDLGPLPSMESLFTSLCDELSNQWTSLMSDPWGSHLVRAALNVASGESLLPPKSSSLRSKKSTKYNAKNNNAAPAGPAAKTADRKTAAGISKKRKVPPSFQQVLESISQSVLDSLSEYEIRSFAGHAVANPVLQILVSIKPAGQGLIRSIMEIDSDKGYAFMGSLITDTVGSHLVEKILVNASPKDFHTLYTRHFKGNLTSLASHPIANFVIQHLIQNTRNGLQLRVLMDELLGPDGTGMEKLFFRNRQGVVIKILEACVRHTADCQPQTMAALGFTADSKKGKKKSGDLLLDDEDETPKKKKDSKRAREDDEVDGKEAKKVAAAEDDMEDVFAALAATTKGGDSKKKVKKSK